MRSSRRDGERHHEQAVRGEPSLFTADSQRRGCAEGEGIVRSALTALLVLHGAIHVLGFLAWSKLAPVPQLSGRTLVSFSKMGERIFALAWLLSLLVFLAAAVLRVVRHDAWWVLALGAVVLSQSLIVLAWPDAKFGTLANALILVPTIIAAAQARFGHHIDAEVRALYAAKPAVASVVERAELDALPAPVRRWLENAGVVGRERVQSVRLKQRGELRTRPDAAFMPARAEQYFSVDPPAFIWRVDATMLGIVPIAGRDRYVAGRGNMLIKAASLVNVVDAADEKIDHGSMLRFVGEMVWFPAAALSSYITWQPIDDTRAQATMRYAGLTASATLSFDPRGRVVGMQAERYLGGGADAKLTPWLVTCSEWRRFEGIEVPSKGDVGWELESGYFSYYRWEILDLQFNRREPYREDDRRRAAAVEPIGRAALDRTGASR